MKTTKPKTPKSILKKLTAERKVASIEGIEMIRWESAEGAVLVRVLVVFLKLQWTCASCYYPETYQASQVWLCCLTVFLRIIIR